VMAGETVEARFRDSGTNDWQEGSLAGWKLRWSGARWIDSDGGTWDICQVYREPSWWLERPDPGPGYRLLGKMPDEKLKPGDECLGVSGEWRKSSQAKAGGHQLFGMWYRRRIEPVEPEPQHYVLRVGDSVETPRGHLITVVSSNAEQRIYSLDAGDKLTLPNGQTITITEKGFEVTQ